MAKLSLSPFATQLQDEIEFGERGMFRKFLVKTENHQTMLICLHAGITIPEHTSSFDGFITVIQGKGIFWLAGQEVVLEPGVFIKLPANTLHGFTVSENLAMLKVVDRHDTQTPAAEQYPLLDQEQPCERSDRKGTCAESIMTLLKPYLAN